MPLDALLPEIAARYQKIRSGLDVGFNDEDVSQTLREFRGGVWMSLDARASFPFEDAQFEVVVMNGSVVSRAIVREANRVLRPEGCLFFTVPEKMGSQEGYTLPNVYSLVRDGFNIVGVERPRWRLFRRRNRTLTICAQKKNWRSAINKFRPYI